MNFIQDLRHREHGQELSLEASLVIPRLSSSNDDMYLKMGLSDERSGDQLYYGECLVGRFCPYYQNADLFALTDEDGFVIIQDTSQKGEKSIKCNFRAHKNAIFDLTWMRNYAGALTMVTGAGDTTVAMWDAETHKRLCVFNCHDQCIRSVAAHRDIPGFLATGARDGKICIHDHRCEKNFPVNTITGAHIDPDERKNLSRRGGYSSKISVTSLVLKDENYLISGGFTDGLIKVWDLRRTYMATAARQPAPVYSLPVGATVTSLILQPGGSKLYASCKNNAIYCFDAINFNEKPECKFVGHSTSSKLSSYLQCGLSSCGRYLACGSSGDNFVHVWDTSQDRNFDASVSRDENGVRSFQPVATLVEGHTDGVHCTQWSAKPGELKLASLSDDNTHRIWRLDALSLRPPDAGPSPENPRNASVGNVGYAVMSPASLVKPRRKPCHRNNLLPVTLGLELSDLPNFVHNPDSVIHKCSPRVPKLKMNWLTALSPQNRSPSPSSGKVVKLPRPSTKRKSSKKLQLVSSQFKTILKPQPPKY